MVPAAPPADAQTASAAETDREKSAAKAPVKTAETTAVSGAGTAEPIGESGSEPQARPAAEPGSGPQAASAGEPAREPLAAPPAPEAGATPAKATPAAAPAAREAGAEGRYSVQVAAFAVEENARRMVADLEARGYVPYLVALKSGRASRLQAVRFGHFAARRDALQAAADFQRKEGLEATVQNR
jgi:cell division septation protein DedD